MKKKVNKKTALLKKLINSAELSFLLEAHNGISAKIVEETGFDGIWASGFGISASLGVRDNNEASWTQVLDIVEFMSDSSKIPILLDGDTGFGNFNNMRRLVKKLEQKDIAGVCIEDKLFPKTNSFIEGKPQQLAEIDEFCGKIKAGKDVQMDDDFCIVARVEAFIAGLGLKEALKRAEAYTEAGADAILIHSKKRNPEEIESFMKEWGNRHPVVIVPTKYYATPTQRFEELGISTVIWANHLIRSAAQSMQKTAEKIKKDNSIINIEDKIAPIAEIFRLQGEDELRKAEKQYLPQLNNDVKSIILAASQGYELGDLTANKPKALLEINGEPVLKRMIKLLNDLAVEDITVVRGFHKGTVKGKNFKTVDNDEHENTRDLYSLYKARAGIAGKTLIIYGDVLLRRHLVVDLIRSESELAIVVDADILEHSGADNHDYVFCSKPYSNDFFNLDISLEKIEVTAKGDGKHGEWAGILYASETGSEIIRDCLEEMSTMPDFKSLSMTDMLNIIAEKHKVSVVYTKGGWININKVVDFEKAGGFYA